MGREGEWVKKKQKTKDKSKKTKVFYTFAACSYI